MLIDSLTMCLAKSGCLDGFWNKLDAGADATLGVAASARPFLVASRFSAHPQATLVVVPGEDNAVSFSRTLSTYLGDSRVLRFPEREDYPFAPKPAKLRTVARRMEALWALSSGRQAVVVASSRALLRMLAPEAEKAAAPLVLKAGQELADIPELVSLGIEEMTDLVRALEERGYANTGELDGPGTFAIRGGVIDVFPGNLIYPVRLDFFGDELEDIRRIVPATGQCISPLEQVEIFPVVEYAASPRQLVQAKKRLALRAESNPALRDVLEKMEGGLRFDGADVVLPLLYDRTVTIGDYVGEGALTVLVEPRALFDDAKHAHDEIVARAKGTNIALDGLFAAPERLDFGSQQRATYVSFMRAGETFDASLVVKRTEVAGHPDKLFGKLRNLMDANNTVVFCAANRRARQDMMLAFVEHGLPIVDASAQIEELDEDEVAGQSTDHAAEVSRRRLRKGVVNVVDAEIPLGMIIPEAKLALVSISDTQGNSSSTRASKPVDITQVTFPFKPGDYVVHAAHGVALFKDIVQRQVDDTVRDYLLLQYAEEDRLYVPVEQLDRVTRYVGPEGAAPRLTRLNTSDWSRALARARKATKKLAFDLVDIYTRRASVEGYRFSEDTPWQREMEGAFPYQETADQLSAIADVKADMCSSKPMDRLICGDVGFGKTEVAMRAAFKATQDSKQVMVLCPTTILAQQHFSGFAERFEPFGVRVEVLSRFRDAKQQQRALEGFANGSVDVLVGTHRLLSRDVNPHDLGLIIIDEEQRFGVGHKEQLKNMRESVDVLALSATPIPRTLQMSLSGVRDMSLIMTPPDERRPVQVHVGEWDPDLVSGAISRELDRGGQVYYVSNRVRSIEEAVARVSAAAPEARVGVAHGQMSKESLEHVMEDFSAGELDVLVATTIIESGIDNPHTNTLIIEDSQRLGLSQMYQLKGRVGRSSQQAYAYFMFPSKVAMTEESMARLTALYEHQDLGSGMRIAMRDLEIRGAGNLLGAEQSGNMSDVGFDLFAQMLQQAVQETREGSPSDAMLPAALSDISVNIPGHAYLSNEYIADGDERVAWYRRIACASTMEAANDVARNLEENHPDMPDAAKNLIAKARIKAFANEHHIKIVSVVAGRLVVEPIELPKSKLPEIKRAGGKYLSDKSKLSVPLKYFNLKEGETMFSRALPFLEELLELGKQETKKAVAPDVNRAKAIVAERQRARAREAARQSGSRSRSVGAGYGPRSVTPAHTIRARRNRY